MSNFSSAPVDGSQFAVPSGFKKFGPQPFATQSETQRHAIATRGLKLAVSGLLPLVSGHAPKSAGE
jgi:hypothetical protein